MWSETKPEVVPAKRAGRALLHLFRATCLHFFPSPVLLSCTDCWDVVKKDSGLYRLSNSRGMSPFYLFPSESPLLSDSSLFSVSQVQAQPRMTVSSQISGRWFMSQRARPKVERTHRLR